MGHNSDDELNEPYACILLAVIHTTYFSSIFMRHCLQNLLNVQSCNSEYFAHIT